MSANPANLEMLKTVLAQLAAMGETDYQAQRKEFARTTGASLKFLDREYARLRRGRFKDAAPKNTPDPWPAASFTIVGVRGEEAVFLDSCQQLVIGVPSKQRLLGLASKPFWSKVAPGDDEGGVDFESAIPQVAERARRAGIFSVSSLRGRGPWLADDERLELHCGDRVLVDGKSHPVGKRGRYIYPAGEALGITELPPPLSVEECAPIRELFNALHWRNPSLDPLLVMGFLPTGQIGGALPWRSNLSIVAASQQGKTTLLRRALGPLMPFRYRTVFTSQSTEAGIRQSIAGDSLCWLYDEAEVAGNGSNVQRIFNMLRGASSADVDDVSAKGTTHGRALRFTLRSPALLVSINSNITDSADASRISVVEFKASGVGDYRRFIEPLWKHITPKLGLRLFSRVVQNFDALRANINLFRDEVGRRLRTERGGDQFGSLLAGAFLLEHDGIATGDEVSAWLDRVDWGEHAAAARGGDENDEAKCLHAILGQHIDVNVEAIETTDDGKTRARTLREKRTLAELIDIVRGSTKNDGVAVADAESILSRYGVRVDAGRLWISNRCDALAKALAGYAWSNHAWRVLLRRISGALTPEKPQKFAGVPHRYTSLPLDSTCSKCRSPMSADGFVCQHCGTPLRDGEAPF